MKKFSFTLVLILLFSATAFSQAPQAINYQAVVRDTNGVIISDQNVSLKISILSDSLNGFVVYSETHNVVTNSLGLVNIAIGRGQVTIGDFANINWGITSYYIKTETDLTGGANYLLMGISQLLSVPYSLNSGSLVLTSPNGTTYEVTVDNDGNILGECFPQPSPHANAGFDQYNIPGSTTILGANHPTVGQGLWSIETGSGGMFFEPSNPQTTFQGINDSTYVLIWTISNNCSSTSDTVIISFLSQGLPCGIPFTDNRDGNVYNTVQIGSQCWIAENLAYLPAVSPSSVKSKTTPYYYVYDYQGTDVIAATVTNNYQTYGVLYNWTAAMAGAGSSNSVPSGVQGVCPAGWHLPSDAEWTVLTDYLGGEFVAGGKMKETGTTHWNSPNIGATNSSGFSAFPGGFYYADGKSFLAMGIYEYFWSSTEHFTGQRVYHRLLETNSAKLLRYDDYKDNGYSIRCICHCSPQPTQADAGIDQLNIQGTSTTLSANTPTAGQGLWTIVSGTGGNFADSTNPGTLFNGVAGETYNLLWTISNNCGSSSDTVVISFASPTITCGTPFTDSRDGNIYNTVQIGTQCWMAENLAYLPSVSPSSDGSVTTPYYYVYDYQGTDVNAAKATSNYQTYGVLYNWSAAMAGQASSNSVPSGVQGICPNGWHLPSDGEWTVLTNHLGGDNSGGKMKEAGTTHWNSPNSGATNSSGFTALGGGQRYHGGSFCYFGIYAHFWSSTEDISSRAWTRYLDYVISGVGRGTYYKENGFSVRCCKD